LPEEHYAGMTKDLLRRISSHKKLGKIVDGYEIVGQFENPKLAHLMETKLHIMGYNGFQYSG
jgi:predicted GIY-YIG superfamily endonuclease